MGLSCGEPLLNGSRRKTKRPPHILKAPYSSDNPPPLRDNSLQVSIVKPDRTLIGPGLVQKGHVTATQDSEQTLDVHLKSLALALSFGGTSIYCAVVIPILSMDPSFKTTTNHQGKLRVFAKNDAVGKYGEVHL